MDMFGFGMVGSYKERVVANTELDNGAVIDTARVTDSHEPFETGITHPDYNDNRWIIVELYPDRLTAEAGHVKWCEVMKSLPDALEDVSTAWAASMLTALDGPQVYTRK